MLSYIKKLHYSCVAFNPTYPENNPSQFPRHDWRRFYDIVEEPILLNMSKPLQKPFVIHVYVDADQLSRSSHTGYIMFLNPIVINWYSKKQGSIERAMFGSEFMVFKTALNAGDSN